MSQNHCFSLVWSGGFVMLILLLTGVAYVGRFQMIEIWNVSNS